MPATERPLSRPPSPGQRCSHLGGALGAQLLTHMLHERWLMRTLDTRALTVTPRGRKRLAAVFDISS
ncbi:hypothetical protein LOY39_14545 [Pseudomonas rhodesiae]|uniref:hypothetical protein n=1 Tax=Pseudomonas rhodesiae TaxID=76760 RepID=UPI001BCF5D0E|nr:hypothetical protein [Pseudomonas rhodesiae]QVN05156.1 hypothetical protein JYG35_15975 [Pseudomonas rhodesiae]UVL06940.1 hypothetical protein LOY39_14545 [Pseudomonas rhodesiae]